MRTIKGTITGTKMDKTIIVVVHRYKSHPKYKKRYRVSKKYYAHAPEGKHEIGDKITIYETRPVSKLKKWTTVKPESTTSSDSQI
jgi:small subunit ribosomal protein S17